MQKNVTFTILFATALHAGGGAFVSIFLKVIVVGCRPITRHKHSSYKANKEKIIWNICLVQKVSQT
jgi:hypothetical protein